MCIRDRSKAAPKRGIFVMNKWAPANLARQQQSASPLLAYAHRCSFSKKTVPVPSMGDSISDGVVFELLKKAGDYVKQDEIVAIIETDKVKVDIKSPESGVLVKLFAQQGDTVEVGKDFFEIDLAGAQPAGQAAPQQQKKQETAQESKPQKQQPTQEKPQQAAKPSPQQAAPQQAAAQQKAQQPQTHIGGTGGVNRNERREKMSRMRLKIAQRLKDAQNTCAMLTTFQEVDMSQAIQCRNDFKDEFLKKHGAKLGFMSFFIKAAVAALKDQPAVNAVIVGNEIIYREYVDLSVAVATPTGLIVPVLRNCENMSFADVEKGLELLAKKGKDGTITAEEMAGGTFTISNGGIFGSLMGTPIINPPQSAILGMHAIVNRPVVVNDTIVARPMMYLALTYDHRLIDGREAVTFLKRIKSEIEDPRRLLLDI
eukprot:TRINITY_DN3533_c0_g3_i4.p1 TRINITY_DN3533_c0_g3~~TRINITY_DN3533_c0_g3_i4.p1  ORF type:complete len:427 (-),score=115.80 TRINITY_DN3533_c0_g3_i4:84-1364(-)